jgi:catechol 2,3-dioxygenase
MSAPSSYGVPPAGYRLPDATRLGRAVIQVADVDRSIGYYTNVVGLRVIRRNEGTVGLGPQGSDEVLLELRERKGARPVPREGRLGLFHVAILVPDRPSLASVLKHLLGMKAPVAMSDHFVSEALYLWDPDGLGLEIYADRPRRLWRPVGRQLYMTTERLDAAELLSEAKGDWTGLPRGTVVGHVHLSVDDLARASAFYHDGIGFDRIVWSYPGALFMSAGGYHHHLGTNTWAAEAPAATEEDARLVEWEIQVPAAQDARAVAESLRHAGADPRSTADGWRAVDPWGVAVAITPATS